MHKPTVVAAIVDSIEEMLELDGWSFDDVADDFFLAIATLHSLEEFELSQDYKNRAEKLFSEEV